MGDLELVDVPYVIWHNITRWNARVCSRFSLLSPGTVVSEEHFICSFGHFLHALNRSGSFAQPRGNKDYACAVHLVIPPRINDIG